MPEGLVRPLIFVAVLAAMFAWEWRRPVLVPLARALARRLANLGLGLTGVLATRLLAPAGLATAALYAASNGWGLFNAVTEAAPIAFLATVLVLDLAVWAQHRVSHAVPLLWRLHRIHHADPVVDVTTAVRFHPLEIVLSLAWKSLVVVALGAPVAAAIAFEVLLGSAALFNHGNVRLPPALERLLAPVLVTPSIHRVHHSRAPAERDRNFGFSVTWWDRMFGTFRAPAADGTPPPIGLPAFAPEQALSFGRMLLDPLHDAR